MLMDEREFQTYFDGYAKRVDNFYEADYWHFSDRVIQGLIARHLGISSSSRVLEAGGGTGRWAQWMVEHFDADVMIVDRSPSMLAEADRRAAALPPSKITTAELDLTGDVSSLPGPFDALTAIYGVLSFVEDPAAFLRNAHSLLRPGGRMMLMSHSLATAVETKLLRDGPEAAEAIETSRTVQWAPDVPRLRVFSSDDLRELANDAGFVDARVFGVTNVLRPGEEDFGYPYTALSAVSKRLQDPRFLEAAVDVDIRAAEREAWADRGTNLIVMATRPEVGR